MSAFRAGTVTRVRGPQGNSFLSSPPGHNNNGSSSVDPGLASAAPPPPIRHLKQLGSESGSLHVVACSGLKTPLGR